VTSIRFHRGQLLFARQQSAGLKAATNAPSDIRVLALDTSTHTGWCHSRGLELPPAYGTLHLGAWDPDHVGAAYLKLFNFVIAKCDVENITHVVVETPLGVYAHSGWAGKKKFDGKARKDQNLAAALLGFVVAAETATGFAAQQQNREIEFFQAYATSVRAHFVGNGRPNDPKAHVMARCRQLGYAPADDNQGDAIATWDFATSRLAPTDLLRVNGASRVARGKTSRRTAN
jgi:hypothetical protein